jgi:hypothetical protein
MLAQMVDPSTYLPVVGIVAIPGTITGIVAMVNAIGANKKARESNEYLAGNGKGTVPAMLEDLLEWQEKQDVRLSLLEARPKRRTIREVIGV